MGATIYLVTLFAFISVTAFVLGAWFYFRHQREEVRLRLGRMASYGAGTGNGTGTDTRTSTGTGARGVTGFGARAGIGIGAWAGSRSGSRAGRSSTKKPDAPSALGWLLEVVTRAVSKKGREGAIRRKASGGMVLVGARLSLALVLALAMLGVSVAGRVRPFESTMLVTCGFLVGFMVPGAMAARKNRAREMAMRKALPDLLDLLTMSVEAGLGFDRALAKVIEGRKGPLVDEFEIVLQEIRVGRPRREALRDLGERVKMPEISRLIGAIIQAEQLGMGIANSLRIQSEQLRLARRQRAEEAAMKAPIKMLFPLIFFIFPALFVVLLGPAIIQMVIMFVRVG